MAKFNKTVKQTSVIPTAIEGIYVKDLTIKELKVLQDRITEVATEDDATGQLLVLFEEVIRAEDGTVFEDMLDAESLSENLSFSMMVDISTEVSEVLTRGSQIKK